MKALRVIAKQEGVKSYSRLKKADLIQAIRDARETPDLFTPQEEEDVTAPEPEKPVEPEAETESVTAPQGQIKMVMTDLMETFLKKFRAGSSVTVPGSRNVEHVLIDEAFLELNPQEALQYQALMFVLSNPEAPVTIRISDVLQDNPQPNPLASVTVSGKASGVKVLKKTPQGRGKGIEYSNEEDLSPDYELVTTFNGQEVVLGYVPRVGTLLEQAARLQLQWAAAQENKVPVYEGDKGDNSTYWKDSYANANLNALQAIQHADAIAQLREYLDSQPSGQVQIKGLATREAFDGSPRRGSLLRPSARNMQTLESNPAVVDAVKEFGICIMLHNKDKGAFLYNLKTQSSEALPYQDGVMGMDGQYSLRKNNNSSAMGAIFIPIPDPNRRAGSVMWVRMPEMSLKDAGLVDLVQNILISEENYTPEKRLELLGQYMSVTPKKVTLESQIQDNFTGAAYVKSTPGATRTLRLYKDGKVILQYGEDNKPVNNRVVSAEVLGEFKFRIGHDQGESGQSQANYQKDINDLKTGISVPRLEDAIIQNGKLPVAPVVSESGEILGYHHPVPALRIPPSEADKGSGKQNQQYNPETQSSQLPIAIDMAQLLAQRPDNTRVVEEEGQDGPKKGTKETDTSNDTSAFGGAAFMTVERAMVSDLNKQASTEDQAAAEAWMAENLPHVPFRRVKGLINRGGVTAYGIWEQGMVKVSDISVVGTEFHEAFHAVMDTYLSKSRRDKILAEAKAKYGDLGPVELEEALAEAFREYVLTEGLSMKDKSAIRRFFTEIAALVKAMFQGQYRTRQLMQQINRGKYAYKPSARSTNFLTKFSKVPAFTVMELKELEQLMPLMISGIYSSLQPALQSDDPVAVLNKAYPKAEDQPIRDALIEIASEIKELSTPEPEEAFSGVEEEQKEVEDKGPTHRERKLAISKLLMETIFNERGYIQLMMNMSQSESDMVQAMRERLKSQKGVLINHFATNPQAQRLVMQGLNVNEVTGTTAAEQYGGTDMAEINPMDKVPASIKNMISKTVYIPAAHSAKIIEAVSAKSEVKEKILEEANALQTKGSTGYANLHDQHSHFGLPRFLRFETVYPYLLHHLSTLPSYEAMEAKMIELSKYNPSLAMVVLKMNNDPKLKAQFYVGMKRANSQELVINIEKKDVGMGREELVVTQRSNQIKAPVDILTYNNLEVIQDTLKRMSVENRSQTASVLDNAVKAGDVSTSMLRKVLNKLRFTSVDPAARDNTLDLLTAEERVLLGDALRELFKTDSKASTAVLFKKVQLVSQRTKLHLADMGAIQSMFASGVKSKYAHMNPCYLSELFDALNHTQSDTNTQLKDKLNDNPHLLNSLWHTMLTKGDGLKYRRYGTLRGVAYEDMNLSDRMEYDILAALNMQQGEFQSGYSPIPTPSDADGTYMVQNDFLTYGQPVQDEILAAIYDAERRVLHKSLPIEVLSNPTKEAKAAHVRQLLEAEAQALLKVPEAQDVISRLSSKHLGGMPAQEVATNYVMASYVSNWNTSNWVGGTIDHFKGDITKYQKRFKHVQSPGQTSADNGTFKNVTIADPQTTEGWATQVQYKNGQPVVKDGKYVLENAPIDRADAQSYVTLDFFERMLESHGEMTEYKKAVFEKARNGEALTVNEQSVFAPYKPFYFGWIGGQPHQIKNSVIPLLPPVKGMAPISAELDNMRKWMESDNNKVDQVTLSSAHKVGAQQPTVLFEDGKFVKPKGEYVSYDMPMTHHRNQVAMVEHAKHNGTVNLGNQTSRIITGGLREYEGLGQEMIDKLSETEQKLYNIKLKEFKGKLFRKELNETSSSERYQVDIVKLREYVLSNLRDDVHPAVVEMLESADYADRNAPMIAFVLDAALKAAVQADYKGQRVAGGQQVQISDLGHLNPKTGEDLQGMRVVDGKVLPAEVKMNRKFLPAHVRDLSIEEIEKLDPTYLEVMVYRVPAEGKNSMAMCKVVEFLPAGQDGIVIPAAFVAQMGSDFDIDKLFVNWVKRARPGKMLNRYDSTANEYFKLQKEVLMHPEVVKNEVLQPQGFETIKAFRTENMKTRMMGETNIVQHMKMYPYGVMAHLQMHQDNMAGVGLKATAADNNSFWLQMQRYGIELEGINMADIPLEIIKWNAEAVAASMDGAKDPVWGTMGINKLNFSFFMYECTMGYMRALKLGNITTLKEKQAVLRRVRKEALQAATDPSVLYLLENFDAPIDQTTASDNEKRFGKYKQQITKSGEVYGMRRAVNVSKMKMRELEKLVDVPDAVLDSLTEPETNDDARGVEVLELPVIKGALDITRAAQTSMGGLGIYFYGSTARALKTDFGTYTSTQTTTMADEHVSLSKNLDAILGTRGTDGKLRDIDLEDVSTWNIPQWLTYFQTTTEGQALVAENPALQRMLLHISHDGSYEVSSKRYDRITPLQLSDPMNVLEFQNAWNSLYNPPDQYEGEVHYPSKFAQALVTYEAARSGWRKSPRFNFSGHLPTEIVRSTAINNEVAAESIAAYKVLDPRIQTVGKLDTALLKPFTVKYKGEIYINVVGLDPTSPGKVVRTKVKAPNTTIGFRGTQSLADIAAELQDNAEEVQTAIEERKEELSGKKSQSRKAMGGTAANTSERIAHLQSRFASYGVKVRVVLDSTLDAAGEVEYSASEGVIRIHPDRLKSDTVIHEFAHIYVEMLGFDHPAVQAVITELRDTPLWREISELYPDLSARDLAMEVVVTAMGIEGDAIFEESKNPNKLRTLINKLLRALGKLIGIQPNTARELVRDMIGGTSPKVSKLGSFRAQQRLNKNLEAGALLQEVSDELLSRVDHMRRLGATTTEQQDLMDRISRDAHAFGAVAEKNDVAALDTLNIRMVDYIKDATVFIEEATSFVDSSQVGNLTEADINMMNKAYQLNQVLTTFKQAFDSYQSKVGGDKYVQVNQQFRELQPRVQVVQNNLDNMIKKMLSKKLIQNSTNPKLKEAMEAAADIFSLSQTEFGDLITDTSQAEVQFLGVLEQDSNPVLTLFGKTIRNVINTEEMNAKNDIAEMQAVLDKFEAEGGKIADLLEPDGKSFISAVRSSFWTSEAKSSDRRRWRAKNMVMEYLPEYYLKYKYVPDNKELQQLKDEIAKYKERDALGLLTADDKNKLGEMEESATAAEQNKKSFRTYHDPTFDMDLFEKDLAEAKADPDPTTLLIFESNFVHESGEPRFGTKYHTGSKVKEKYKNPEWKGKDVPLKKWLNPKADALSPLQVETIEGLKGVMQKAYGNPEARMFTQSLIPQIEKPVAQSLTETLRNMPRKAIALNEDKARMSTDSNGRKIFMRGGLKHSYRSEGSVSTDLRLTMAQFIVEARAQQASNNIETFSLMTRDQLSDMDLTARKGWKLQFKEGQAVGKKEGNRSTIKGERSNSMDMMEHVLEGYLGEGWQTTGKYDKQAAWMQSFTSWQGLAINPSAWINNFMYGELQQILDSVGGDMYTSENLKKAGGVVFSHVMDLAKSRDKGVMPESKTAALLNFFDATMDQRELPEGAELRGKFFDMAFIGQSLGEVVMQSQVVLAMMYETKVRFKDGTTGNLYDAVKWEAGMGRNVKLVEGAVVLRKDGTEVPLDMAYMGAFKTKSVAVLQRIHGAYNSEDLGRFHRKAIGRLVLQFRKWMPQALKKRFGADRYSEAREQAEIGYYRALWMKVIIPSIIGSESDKKMRFLAQYNSQDPHVQIAVKRALYEISMGVTAALLSYVLAALIEVDGDDDEELFFLNDEYYKAKLLFHAARLSQELNSYTPWGMYDTALRIGQDPTAALRQFKTFAKLLYQVGLGIAPGVELERFRGGHNYGDLKVTKYTGDLAFKQVSREMNAITNHNIYKLS